MLLGLPRIFVVSILFYLVCHVVLSKKMVCFCLGIVLSMKTQSEKKIAKERSLKQAAEEELVKFREYCTAQEREIEALQLLLTQHGIEFQKMEKPNLPVRTIDVVAEVNQYIDATKMASIGVDPTVKS